MLLYAKLDENDMAALQRFRLDVKKRLFVLNKDSLYPQGRLDKVSQGKLSKPVISFEGISPLEQSGLQLEFAEEPGAEAEQRAKETPTDAAVSLEQRKVLLAGLYAECEAWYSKLKDKINASL
jgi:hypothetical protein